MSSFCELVVSWREFEKGLALVAQHAAYMCIHTSSVLISGVKASFV
jgi:hypothetical protein